MENSLKARIGLSLNKNAVAELKKEIEIQFKDINVNVGVKGSTTGKMKEILNYATELKKTFDSISGSNVKLTVDTKEAKEKVRELTTMLSKPMLNPKIKNNVDFDLKQGYLVDLKTAQDLATEYSNKLDSLARKNDTAFNTDKLKSMKIEYQEMINVFNKGLTTGGGIPQFQGQDLTINKMKNGMTSLVIETEKYNQALKESNAVQSHSLEIQKAQDKIAKIKTSNAGFLSSAKGGKASKDIDDVTNAIKRYSIEATKANKIDLDKKMSSLSVSMADAKQKTFSMSEMLTNAGKKFLAWMSITQVVMTAIRGIKLMVDNVRELDTSLIELQKVSELTGTSLEKFVDKSYESASKLGRTGRTLPKRIVICVILQS